MHPYYVDEDRLRDFGWELSAHDHELGPFPEAGVPKELHGCRPAVEDLLAEARTGNYRLAKSSSSALVVFVNKAGTGIGRLGRLTFDLIQGPECSGTLYPSLAMAGVTHDAQWDAALEAAMWYGTECGFGLPKNADLRWDLTLLDPQLQPQPRQPNGQGIKLQGASAGLTFFLGLFASKLGGVPEHGFHAKQLANRLVFLALLPSARAGRSDELRALGGSERKKLQAIDQLRELLAVELILPATYLEDFPSQEWKGFQSIGQLADYLEAQVSGPRTKVRFVQFGAPDTALERDIYSKVREQFSRVSEGRLSFHEVPFAGYVNSFSGPKEADPLQAPKPHPKSQVASIDLAVIFYRNRFASPLPSLPALDGNALMFRLLREGRPDLGLLVYQRRDADAARAEARLLAIKEGREAGLRLSEEKLAADDFVEQISQSIEIHPYRSLAALSLQAKLHLSSALSRNGLDRFLVHHWEGSPYRRLEVFDLDHAEIFFGRDSEVIDILERLHDREREQCAFVCIIGASGSGKSSLARAGVAAWMRETNQFVLEDEWVPIVFLPGESTGPVTERLCRALHSTVPLATVAALAGMIEPEDASALVRALDSGASSPGKRRKIVLVVDQLEELWSEKAIDDVERERFFKALRFLASTGRVRIIATLRSDFYPLAQSAPGFLALKGERGHVDLVSPNAFALHEMILAPAKWAGVDFEEDEKGRGLDEEILKDALLNESALPMLELCLDQLFLQRNPEKGCLTFAAYKSLGGLDGVLAALAQKCFQKRTKNDHEVWAKMLWQLVEFPAGGRPVRARASLTLLRDGSNDEDQGKTRSTLIDALIAKRLLVVDKEVVRLAHESLLDRWEPLQDWTRENSNILSKRDQLEKDFQRWIAGNQNPSLLLPRGKPLDDARDIVPLSQKVLGLNRDEIIRFVDLSLANSFAVALESGENLQEISDDLRQFRPEVWTQEIRSSLLGTRVAPILHACQILSDGDPAAFVGELEQALTHHDDDRVREVVSSLMIDLAAAPNYERIAQGGENRSALASLLAAAEFRRDTSLFGQWFGTQDRKVQRQARSDARRIRARRAVSSFAFLLLPAMFLAVTGAASVKWFPSALNWSCLQATASLAMGIFHSAASGILLGGMVVLGLSLYWSLFSVRHRRVYRLGPAGAVIFGGAFGLIAGLIAVVLVALVYQPNALHQIGWSPSEIKPGLMDMAWNIWAENRCGWCFPLTSIGYGIGAGIMFNVFLRSEAWREIIDNASETTGWRDVARKIWKIACRSFVHAWPIPVFVTLFAAIAFVVMKPVESWPGAADKSLQELLLGGLDEPLPAEAQNSPALKEEHAKRQVARRVAWKTSNVGRACGLAGDCAAKIAGGYLCIVGMFFGAVLVRHGVRVDPRRF